jgi:CheY-like chemotaxis protein
VAYVVADEGKIRQVLVNLLGNAVKFTQTGKVTLRASLEQKSADELWLMASVEDTGFGLTAEEQAKLFQPFSQTSRGIHSQEGTGLGLAISRKCARLMGGDVTVTSNPGEGSTFRFEIPVGRGEAGVALKRTVPRRVVGIQGGTESPRILVVDDQLENRDWLTKLLTLVGFTVQAAENGEVAIRTCDEWKPQLILMDMHMPVMNGLEATRIIKARPRGKETTIVTLTASALDQDRHTVLESGADDFLSKPCREEELLEKMGSLLHIVYDYEESDKTDDPPSPGLTALKAATLDQLPAGIIEELREATSNGSKKRLNQLIARVREIDHAGPADALQELANKYEYDTLTKLLEEASQHSSSQRS